MTRLAMLATAAAAALSFGGSTAEASTTALQHDRNAIAILTVMHFTLKTECHYGNQYACAGKRYVEDLGGHLWAASQACDYGNWDACDDYQRAYGEMQTVYYKFSHYFDAASFGECGLTYSQAKHQIKGWSDGWNGDWNNWSHRNWISYLSH